MVIALGQAIPASLRRALASAEVASETASAAITAGHMACATSINVLRTAVSFGGFERLLASRILGGAARPEVAIEV
jgi:hypothetical protein